MTCNDAREKLAALDRDRKPPRSVQAHLRKCPECRRIARAATTAERSAVVALAPGADHGDDRIVADVMDRIAAASSAAAPGTRESLDPRGAPGKPAATAPVTGAEAGASLVAWIFGAMLLAGALVGVRFSEPFQYLTRSPAGRTVDLWVTLSLATILAGYLCVFAAGRALRGGDKEDDGGCRVEAE
jgi:hypothetical protein